MKKLQSTYLLIFIIALPLASKAQILQTDLDSVAVDVSSLDTVSLASQADSPSEKEKPAFTVQPWQFHAPIGARAVETDSTLRWQVWPGWVYKLNRDPGIISYRMGTSIRNNAVQRYAHEPRHQQLYWGGVPLNDPVSGAVNWSFIPQHKIGTLYQKELGLQHRTTYYQRQYYLRKPLSKIIYSESKFNFRNLEFEVSHNFSRRMNIELSYWDRRAGGEYSNSEIAGQQIFGKISYHLDRQQYLKFNFLNNSYDIAQPFGYTISDMRLFNFDRFSANANQSSAQSKKASTLWGVHYFKRKADSTLTTDNLHAGIYYRGNERSLTSSPDSTSYNVGAIGGYARKWFRFGGMHLKGDINVEHFLNKTEDRGSLPASNWTLLRGEGRLKLDFTPIIDLKGGANISYRTDGFQSYRLDASSNINVGRFTLTPGAAVGTVMPTQQQLYWDSKEFSGNPSLSNEKMQEVRGTLSYHFSADSKIGVRGQHKEVTDGIIAADSSFTNVSNYSSQAASFFFNLDLTHFELNGSATVHRFADSFLSPNNSIPMDPTERIWLKGGAYWKGYLFNRATYIKAGVSGMMAPFRYQADHYSPVLDTWQPVSNDQQLPVFNRLDVDISARVRSIVFLLRWENVLDDVSQLGYFETANYPMSQRRFIFGVRALFRN